MSRKRLVILDGYSLLFRAFYGSRFLSTSDGRPTNALFGFVGMLFALFTDEKVRPDSVLVALDAPGQTFRHADFAEYKGTRRETPQELISQLVFSRELLSDLNIPTLELTGYEADDIIGTVSLAAKEKGFETVVFTGDHDSFQLVDEDVRVLMPQNGPNPPKLYGPDEVRERYGLNPIQIKDYKGLAGDTSDNIPGVPGIGDKSAVALLQAFGTVEEIAERIEEVEPKFRKKVEPALDVMLLSKKLATIDRAAPVEYDFAPYHLTAEHLARAKEALASLEFRSQVRRLDSVLAPYLAEGAAEAASGASSTVSEPLVIQEESALSSFPMLKAWAAGQPLALLQEAAPASLFEEAPEQWLAACGKTVRRIPMALAVEAVQKMPGQVVGHDIKTLYKRAGSLGLPPRMDVMIGAYVLQSGRGSYELGGLIQGFLDGVEAPSAAQQCAALLLLDKEIRERTAKEAQEQILFGIELPLIPILAEMEGFGIMTSASLLGEFSKSLEVEIEKSKRLVWEMAGEEFNIGSPKQLGEILFEKMKLPGGKKTKTGWATGAEVLVELAPSVPFASEVMNYRELTKLKSTYADALPKMIGPDGRIHTSFNQAVAATGRLSSNEPNLQNIPIRTELGRQIRRAFQAPPGAQLLSLDYSQIELRVLAHMCQDENLVEAFRTSQDVHTVTAAKVFQVEEAAVTKEQRRLAKMLNYAVLYGVTGFGLASQLGAGFSASEANTLIQEYNDRFPSVKAFTDGIVEEARSKGFTTTLSGRRRHFPDIHAGNAQARKYAERQAMNAPIQGTAADMIKLAMLEVRRKLDGSPVKMLLQVHDELVFEAPEGQRPELEAIRASMEAALPMEVPVEVDAKAGANWLDMTPVARQ